METVTDTDYHPLPMSQAERVAELVSAVIAREVSDYCESDIISVRYDYDGVEVHVRSEAFDALVNGREVTIEPCGRENDKLSFLTASGARIFCVKDFVRSK